MPDFDIDFSDVRRGEVIDYVREKYGDDKVAHIATFGTMASKAAIKDAARVLEAPYADADAISKLIPVVFGRPNNNGIGNFNRKPILSWVFVGNRWNLLVFCPV